MISQFFPKQCLPTQAQAHITMQMKMVLNRIYESRVSYG